MDRIRLLERFVAQHESVPVREHRLGDVLGNSVAAFLEFMQPYPGDEIVPFDDARRDSRRFRVLHVTENVYAIEDAYFDETVALPAWNLRVSDFALAQWYAFQ